GLFRRPAPGFPAFSAVSVSRQAHSADRSHWIYRQGVAREHIDRPFRRGVCFFSPFAAESACPRETVLKNRQTGSAFPCFVLETGATALKFPERARAGS